MSDIHEEEVLGKAYDNKLMMRLLRYLKPYGIYVVIAILLLLFSAIAQLAGPYLTKIGIDDYIAHDNFKGLQFICLIYLLVLIFEFLVRFGQEFMVNWIGQKAMYDMRSEIFTHIQKLPVSYFDKNPVGRIVTRITTDVSSLHNMLSSGAVAIFGDVFKLLGIVVVLLAMNWRLALVTFSVLPLIFYATFVFKKLVREIYRVIRIRIAKINSFLQENITGMSVVQIFNREKKNYQQFDELNSSHLDAFLETVKYYSVFYPVVGIISSLAIALIVWYGGGRTIQGSLSFGELVAFIQYAEMFFRPIMDLSEKYNIMQAAMASSERIFKLSDEKPEPGFAKLPKELPKFRGEIEFKNVWFAYKDEDYILKDISFYVKPGEKIAFVGATGAGKTSIMNLLLRFYEVNRGEILIDGKNIKEYKSRELRECFGMVLQDVFIFDGTIKSNIRLQRDSIGDEVITQAAIDVHADTFISKMKEGYDSQVLERGRGLSVGQRQLISFARALAFDPPVLILDEATSSVDTETEIIIQDALERLMRNRTSLVVAHRLSTIQNADRIIVLHKGEIREAGKHQELLAKKGIYYRLYELQYANQEKAA